jgi:putative transposase
MEEWRRYYNEDRPHSGIGQIPPILLHNSGGVSSPSLAQEAEASGLG